MYSLCFFCSTLESLGLGESNFSRLINLAKCLPTWLLELFPSIVWEALKSPITYVGLLFERVCMLGKGRCVTKYHFNNIR